jgi:excisionase family DNA binding protein
VRYRNYKIMERRKSSSATMSPLLTYQEAADYLRISLATIDRMVRAGEISSVLIRGRRLFRIPDLEEYIQSHSIPGGK